MSEEGVNNLLGDSVRELRKLNLNKLEHELGCNTTELTPLRSHYLKKHLISQEIDNELDVLSHPDALSLFGPPFKQSTRVPDIDIPFLKLIFREFVITFPFLKSAPDNFWSDKVQVFVKEFLERNLASTGDEEELTKRRALKMKIQKHLAVLLSSGCKIEGGEAVVKVDGSDIVANKARPSCANSYKMQVNVVTLRVPQKRGIMHNRAHEWLIETFKEFIIHSKLVGNDGNVQEVYVGRRYQDFKLLAQNLRTEFPDEVIPSPPQKDKSSSLAAQDAASSSSSQIDDDVSTPTSLFREKNRLTLRAYLRDLLNISRSVANSSTLQTFLLSNPTALTEEELQDAERRLFNDSVKNSGKDRFKKEMDARADEVMDSVKMFKSDISSKAVSIIISDGFKKMFSIIKDNETIDSLPERYMKVFEWARISFASTIYQTFVGSDTSSETFSGLKRIHALMPYFVLRSILRVSNPIAMVRGVIDLFLAQPFGQRSILQRWAITMNMLHN
ncbi:hypothetical protein E3Q23_02643 [Wallemia mellicola]|uniref:PX domain-containing protein n=1 Tax=Wallemia mellicola TaxID=1708541 RepID=A0A4T0LWU7_9BASI|nr:hypothetical protein E3Q23_02643 [Wallemia mellicola]TIB99299.1 hypothetical protein E3Q17_02683 [Wallemia mellicola]TIC10522.1 hypothetical protein E3Q14_02775 [Wallemia mellicola]TIC11681.1 hypothetical protein E3Q15_02600 [Wallemia mellicola]TIC29281.1 hypothetical protein E3Q10_02706 [Wallemia mellicola]